MTLTDVAHQRLQNQHLLFGLTSADDVVRSLGAVQSQDFLGAKWALGQRSMNANDKTVTELLNEGRILRTHMLRPTWHFVAPEDIRWMQELTSPRVHALNRYYYKKFGLDEATLQKGDDVLARALTGGRELTRDQVKEKYHAAGIDASGLKLAYLLMHAELEALVCSGSLQGKKHTVALLAERAPQAKSLPREEAVAELTRRFFSAHGPATIQDFAWWSSLAMAEIKEGLGLVNLGYEDVAGETFYFAQTAHSEIPSPIVHLLPNYDEYVIAYKDRRPFGQLRLDKIPSYVDLSNHFVMLDGQLVGGWKRIPASKAVTIHLTLFRTLTPSQANALEIATTQLAQFLGLPVTIVNRR